MDFSGCMVLLFSPNQIKTCIKVSSFLLLHLSAQMFLSNVFWNHIFFSLGSVTSIWHLCNSDRSMVWTMSAVANHLTFDKSDPVFHHGNATKGQLRKSILCGSRRKIYPVHLVCDSKPEGCVLRKREFSFRVQLGFIGIWVKSEWCPWQHKQLNCVDFWPDITMKTEAVQSSATKCVICFGKHPPSQFPLFLIPWFRKSYALGRLIYSCKYSEDSTTIMLC